MMERFEQALHGILISDAQEVEHIINLQSDELKLQNKLTAITGNLDNSLKR